MRISEFKRYLLANGVVIKKGRKHHKLYKDNQRSVLSRHDNQEIGEDLRRHILKQLGLD